MDLQEPAFQIPPGREPEASLLILSFCPLSLASVHFIPYFASSPSSMQLGSSSGGRNPVVLGVEPPVASLAPAAGATQQLWGSTPLLLQDGGKLWNLLPALHILSAFCRAGHV